MDDTTRDWFLKYPDKPRDGNSAVLSLSIAPLPYSWFRLRIETDRMCAVVDNDITTRETALNQLRIAADFSDDDYLQGVLCIDFDDESLDSAYMVLSKSLGRRFRLTIFDWCEPELPPRLDIGIDENQFAEEMREAVRAFKELDPLGPTWDDSYL